MQLQRGTLTKISRETGISLTHLSDIFRKRRRPSPEVAAQISSATNGMVTIQELLFPDGIPKGARFQTVPENQSNTATA